MLSRTPPQSTHEQLDGVGFRSVSVPLHHRDAVLNMQRRWSQSFDLSKGARRCAKAQAAARNGRWRSEGVSDVPSRVPTGPDGRWADHSHEARGSVSGEGGLRMRGSRQRLRQARAHSPPKHQEPFGVGITRVRKMHAHAILPETGVIHSRDVHTCVDRMQKMQRTLAQLDGPPVDDEDDPDAVANSSRALASYPMAGVASLDNSPTQTGAHRLTAAAYEEEDIVSTAMNLPALKKDSATSSGHSPSAASHAGSVGSGEPSLPLLALPVSPSPSVTESAQSAGSHPAPLSTGSRADDVLHPINVPGFSAVLPTLAQVVSFAPTQMLPSAEEMPSLDDLMFPSADASSSNFQIACGSYGSFNY